MTDTGSRPFDADVDGSDVHGSDVDGSPVDRVDVVGTGTPVATGGPARHRAPKRRHRARNTLLVLVVIGLVAGILGGLYVRRQIDPGSPGAQVQLTVQKGATTSDIAHLLQSKGVVSSATLFKAYVRVKSAGPFQAGDYTLHRKQGYASIVAVLKKGPEVTLDRVTIPEGFTLEQVAARVGRLPGRSAARFLQLAQTGAVRSQFEPAGSNNLEGLLFPETYFITPQDDEQVILQRMVSAFDDQATQLGIEQAAAAHGLTPYQVVTIASMVEREAKVDEDRGKVASVIYNRLQKKMKLGIDATLIYGLHGDSVEAGKRPNQPNPYNTRLIPALPPTPIASPGRASLQAAITPEQTDFLYYVLADKDGHHAFTASESEFNRLVAQARSKGLL